MKRKRLAKEEKIGHLRKRGLLPINAVAQASPATAKVPLSGTVAAVQSGYVPGGNVSFNCTITYDPTTTAIGVFYGDGCNAAFVTVAAQGAPPDSAPSPGDVEPLAFCWGGTPENQPLRTVPNPLEFTVEVLVPGGVSGLQEFDWSVMVYYLDGSVDDIALPNVNLGEL